ncbi:MAG TPA: amidohydrolase family protein, partial [Vicinamibacterales bacterium]|nr:amidohydrolase family protein [Vicinamibacterales bacterium]
MLSRRELLERAAAGAVAVAGGSAVPRAANAATQNAASRDLVLTNGKFVDGRGQVGTTLAIRNGRITAIGKPGIVAPDARKIDLGGRTVVPGFFDAHVHYTRAGVNPGYEARRIERAFSIKELQEAIAQRAKSVPLGQFITCIGGWNHTQFTESRRPTKAELDEAAPKHAVYISGTGGGTGAITNSLGRTFFASRGVTVDESTGVVAMAAQAVAALQASQTAADKLRGTA